MEWIEAYMEDPIFQVLFHHLKLKKKSLFPLGISG